MHQIVARLIREVMKGVFMENHKARQTGIPLNDWNGSSAVIAATDRQTKKVIRLTWALVALTVVLVFGLGVQIWLAARPQHTIAPGQQQEIQLLQQQVDQIKTLNNEAKNYIK
jgi:hypothetical protein